MGGVCTTACRPQIPKDENSPVKTSGNYLKRKKIFSGGFNLARALSSEHFYSGELQDSQESSGKDEQRATININQACEEDLMIIPGVNRELAHRIVEYRKKLVAFRRVEDLAPCVGALKFEKLKKEVHVSPLQKVATSTRSLMSASSEKSAALVSINTATIAQLSKVPYITEEMCRKVVAYRQKHGHFQHINDLVDPAQIVDVHTFLKIKSYLSVSLRSSRKGHSRQVSSASHASAFLASYCTGFGPECVPSFRSVVKNHKNEVNGRPTVRIASWDLQSCTKEKILNPGVREVVCMTVLENSFRLLTVHGFLEHQVLEEIISELNDPTLPNVQRHKYNSKSWKCCSSFSLSVSSSQQQLGVGFVWDSQSGINYQEFKLSKSSNLTDKLQSEPTFVLGSFEINSSKIHLASLNYHEEAEGSIAKLQQSVNDVYLKLGLDEGDKVAISVTNSKPFELKLAGFENVFDTLQTSTDISMDNPKGAKLLDNFYFSLSLLQSIYAGRKGVVRSGLSNPWIPNGWKWGGLASDHCPIYADLYSD